MSSGASDLGYWMTRARIAEHEAASNRHDKEALANWRARLADFFYANSEPEVQRK